ncbi:hypothetical protein [Fusibacter sp. 3D3]|uniref:hypothetical protein n=1 Tax=Fusibacter sp. 3D3 TaxID=1048380 RepID=UPI0008530396|nr:hypothetical protein [Fusibacter sp. 3D3]GAU77782.1 hypothetical protein F3D3_2411 [Fusibacter sp. 3D3]
MSFKNKRILLLCKETYSYPLYFLAEKWKEDNTVAAFFFMPAECMYNKCYLNESTYYRFLDMKNIDLYDVKDIARTFSDNMNSPKVDKNYMSYVEKTYCHFKKLNMQLMSSQFTTNYYHDRSYYSDFTYEQQMYWLQLNYKRVIDIFEEFKPDVIIDLDDAELPRTIINEVAYAQNIPYITFEHPRYEQHKYPTFNMGIGIDDYFRTIYENCYNSSNEALVEEINYVNNFRSQISIMPQEFRNTITAQYKRDPIVKTIKTLIGKIIYFWDQDIFSGNRGLKIKNKILYPDSLKYVLFYFKVELLKHKLLGKNKYFSDPVEGERYVYMPLHLIPESTTFVKAPLFVNEQFVIEEISKSLPIGWYLYVKEHQSMLGERSVQFYRTISKLPNVKVVSINYYDDPKPWILKAEGVITITGSSAYETAMLGKKALVFGEVPFSLIEGITKVNSLEDLPKMISNFGTIENIKSCAAYIAAVKEAGREIKLRYLLTEGENIFLRNAVVSEAYLKQMDILESFFYDAYARYESIIE